MGQDARLARFAEIEWFVPPAAREEDRRLAPDGTQPLVKKQLHEDGPFHAHAVRLAPGFEVPPHRHDVDELMLVLSGSCELGGETLKARDSVVLAAHQEYGFLAGPDGMEFVIVRTGRARVLGIPGVDEGKV